MHDTLCDLSLASLDPRTYGNALELDICSWPSALGLCLGLGIMPISFPMLFLLNRFYCMVIVLLYYFLNIFDLLDRNCPEDINNIKSYQHLLHILILNSIRLAKGYLGSQFYRWMNNRNCIENCCLII